MAYLNQIASIPTTGARAVAHATVAGMDLLAVPQLAVDIDGSAPDMNGGDSDSAGLEY